MKQLEKEEMEKTIISSLLADYDGLIDYLTIPADSFDYKYAKIIKAMKEIWTWDVTLLASKTNQIKIDDLYDIAGTAFPHINPSEFQSYVETLKDILQREKIIQILRSSALNVEWYGSLWEIYLSIHKEFMELEEFNWENVSDDIKEIMSEAYWEREVRIIPTWYRDLDNLIWGFEKWQVVVAWARPWVWKSMIAINLMMNNVRMWEKVALFSMEMLNKQTIRRLLALTSWIGVWKLKTKLEWAELERVKKWYEELKQRLESMYLIDNCWTIWEIEWKIRYLVHKEWVSIVYIDYLQLIRNPAIRNNPVESITDISQRLKQLALQLWITIVELSQLNRDADKTMVKKASQLRGSGSIEQDADMVWLLDKEDEDSNKITLSVQKCRDGRIWDIYLIQNSDIMQITNLPSKPF